MRRLPSATAGDPMSNARGASTSLLGSSLGRVVGIVIGATIGLVASCYSERVPPPNFRYPCDGDSDCKGTEECIRGLCQIPCTQVTFNQDCPSDGGYISCVNGTCTNLCDVELDNCPAPHECISFDLGDDGGGDGSNPFGGGGGGSSENLGICVQTCNDSDRACPEGEQCVNEFCAVTCGDDRNCPSGQDCIFGLCVPEGLVGGPGGGSDSGSDTGMGDDADTSNSTGGLTEGG